MKKYLKMVLMLVTLSLTAFSCDRSDEAWDVQRWGDLEAVLQVTDLQGKPQSSFREGENFLLNFTVKNRGKQDAHLGPWDFTFANQDFFAVYKVTQEGVGKELIGKPFRGGGNSRDLLSQIVPAKSQIVYSSPWMSEKELGYIMPTYSKPERNVNQRRYQAVETSPLGKGKYFSGFTLEQEGKELTFRVEFEVK